MPQYCSPKGDPRQRFPDLVVALPEQRFTDWEQRGVCICGCGQHPRPRHPTNAYRIAFFVNGHLSTLRRELGTTPPQRYSAHRRAAQRRENMSRTVDGRAILEMVREYIDEHHGGSITDFCDAIGIQHTGLCNNFNRNPRMLKRRAAMLLEAIGETPHPALLA